MRLVNFLRCFETFVKAELLGRIKVLKRLNESQATHTDIRRKQIEKRRNILILNEKVQSVCKYTYFYLFDIIFYTELTLLLVK